MKDQIVERSDYGYLKLKKEWTNNLDEYYTTQYYEDIRERCKHRLDDASTNEIKDINEIEWLNENYRQVKEQFEKHMESLERQIVDIGCGHGNFLEYMRTCGWKIKGIEPSKDLINCLTTKNIDFFSGTVKEYLSQSNEKISCITLNNVLEHLEDPVDILKDLYKMLKDDGIVSIRVPNEFNQLQQVGNNFVCKKDWWVSIPDHVNYFDMQSLCNIVEHVGFEILYKTCDFPMELFLLMGDNYVDDGKVGQVCHAKRKRLEMNLPRDLKENLYKSMADLGLGRNIIVYARKVAQHD